MRVNVNQDEVSRAGRKIPLYIAKLLNDIVEEFCKEYMISQGSAFTYFFDRENIQNLSNLLKSKSISAEHYSIDGLPSWGIIISDDDPTFVEYKLKYGTDK